MEEHEGKFFVVDTFITGKNFSGNPAAVCVLLNSPHISSDPKNFVRIAQEIASVEVAFLLPASKYSKADFNVVFATKNTITKFCGHALIAAAHVILNFGGALFKETTELQLSTASGLMIVRKKEISGELELSLKPTIPIELSAATELREAVGRCLNLNSSRIVNLYAHHSGKNLVVVLKNVDDVVSATPNRNGVLTVLGDAFAKLTITATTGNAGDKASSEFPTKDFVSRLFAPRISIDEDACSAASTSMIGALHRSLTDKFKNKNTLLAHQASTRGGDMTLTFRGKRVGVSGTTSLSARGRMFLPSHI